MSLEVTDAVGRAADPLADDDERDALREQLRRLIGRAAPPERIAAFDEQERFDDAFYAQLADAGVLAIGGPTSFGGSGDVRHQVAVIEELAAGPTSMAAFAILQFMVIQVLGGHGRGEQLDSLRAVMSGKSKISFALSEPDGGTDIASVMKTRAVREPGGFRIRGHKTWISGATRADQLLVLARTSEHAQKPVDGITMFLVPADMARLEISEIATHGIHGLSTCDVRLDGVFVPESMVVGEAERGLRCVFETLSRERLNAAAACVGVARGALEFALGYAREREAFGRPIGAFQALQHALVDVAVRIESARGLVMRAAAVEAAGGRADVLATIAKLAASDAAIRATDVGMRVLAGAGFSRALPMQRWARDARLWTFSPLSDEMCKNYLGERWLRLPRSY